MTAPRLYRCFRRTGAAVAASLLLAAGCGSVPRIRYYELAVPEAARPSSGRAVLAVEELVADAAFEDARIVYRTSPYRLDYYHYHRWSAPPSLMVSDYLRMAFANTGLFRTVTSGYTPDATVVLSGRVLALEEVDVNSKKWLGRVRLELRLRDAASGALLWSRMFAEDVPLAAQSPEGLAKALSVGMKRIVDEAAPELAARASRHAGRQANSQADGHAGGQADGHAGGQADSGAAPAVTGSQH